MKKFEVEWADSGGVLVLNSHLCKMTYLCPVSGLVTVANILAQKTFNSTSHANVEQCVLRMATRKECDDVGVKYIERPVSEGELAELRRDSDLLNYMTTKTSAGNFPSLFFSGADYVVEDLIMGCWTMLGNGKTPREAIIDAMQ